MNDSIVAAELVLAVKELMAADEMLAKYPDSAPTEKERKLWREQAEKRRRHEGVRPRKGSMEVYRQLQQAADAVSHVRFELLTNLLDEPELRAMVNKAKAIFEEARMVLHLCQSELRDPVEYEEREMAAARKAGRRGKL